MTDSSEHDRAAHGGNTIVNQNVVFRVPILQKESDLFPDDRVFSMLIEVAPWEIVRVRSRNEKALARVLRDREQPYYLPQIEKRVQRGGRTFKSYLPLLSGYVFVRRTAGVREALWASGAVVQSLHVEDQERLTEELRQIRSLQLAGAIFSAVGAFVEGDIVRVTDGAFTGYTGTIVRRRGEYGLLVSITALQHAVIAQFPSSALRLLSAAPRGPANAPLLVVPSYG